MSLYRPWFPSLSTGETRPPLPDSELLHLIIMYEISYTRHVSWFLENPELNWSAPRNLLDFIAKARSDGKALVYIGFGSITVPNPKLVTERLVRAVQKSMLVGLSCLVTVSNACCQVVSAQLFRRVGQRACPNPTARMTLFCRRSASW
jgi:hypothetical protein